ncbi:MAG: hypothetical protein WBG90_22895 [Saonia sp.]
MTVLLKSIAYFNLKNVGILSKDATLKNSILKEFPSLNFTVAPYDMIYIDELMFNNGKSYTINEHDIHNDTIILIKGIHRDQNNRDLWKDLKKMGQITVSLDMFYCGVLFFRKEQTKQHFRIRV